MWRRRGEAQHPGEAGATGAGERGSVMIEAAIVIPALFLIVFGALEYGLLFRDSLTGSNVVRAGGRSLSAQANQTNADQAAMQAILPAAAGFSGGLSKVSRVVVYIATCTDPGGYVAPTTPRCTVGDPPIKRLSDMTGAGASCAQKTRLTGVPDRCNVYSGAQLTDSFANDNTKWGCVSSLGVALADNSWCPSRRIASQSTGTDYVGIHIEYSHDWVTGLFGTKRDLAEDVIFRVEPQSL